MTTPVYVLLYFQSLISTATKRSETIKTIFILVFKNVRLKLDLVFFTLVKHKQNICFTWMHVQKSKAESTTIGANVNLKSIICTQCNSNRVLLLFT